MTIPKPSGSITALRHVPLEPQGLNDAAAEARRRVVTQLLDRGVRDTDDLLTIAEYIEHGDTEEES